MATLKTIIAKLKDIKASDMAAKLFAPETLKVLAGLKQENQAEYEALLATWKSGGFGRITALDQAVKKALTASKKEAGEGLSCMSRARAFRNAELPHLLHYQDEWLSWKGSHYDEVEKAFVRSKLWKFLEKEKDCPQKRRVDDVMDALAAVCNVGKNQLEPPCWLDGRDGPDPREIISCTNGLLHVPTRKLMPHTPMFFTRNALEFAYSKAAKPKKWLKRCKDIWPDDPDQEALLQEQFGYLLLPNIRLHRIFMYWGISRGGKTATGNILAKFIGRRNIVSPKLEEMNTQFGLQPFLNKSVAFVTDMRLGKGADRNSIVSHLLRLSGGDPVNVPRKFKDAVTEVLSARVVLVGNVMPALPDETGAIKKRMEFLSFNRSFAGEENRDIERAFDDELPGILNWALDGWDRLKKQGDFTKSETSARRREHMENLASRARPFIDECCVIDPSATTPKKQLFDAFQRYAEGEAITRYSTAAMFHEDLHMGSDYVIENSEDGKSWKGIALKNANRDFYQHTDNDDDPYASFVENHCSICRECGKVVVNQR